MRSPCSTRVWTTSGVFAMSVTLPTTIAPSRSWTRYRIHSFGSIISAVSFSWSWSHLPVPGLRLASAVFNPSETHEHIDEPIRSTNQCDKHREGHGEEED